MIKFGYEPCSQINDKIFNNHNSKNIYRTVRDSFLLDRLSGNKYKKEIVLKFTENFYCEITELFNNLSDFIKFGVYKYIKHKLKYSNLDNESLKVLNKTANWIESKIIYKQNRGEFLLESVDEFMNVVNNKRKDILNDLFSLSSEKNITISEINREIAILLESECEIGNALKYMKKSQVERPTGKFINEKVDQYENILKNIVS